MNIEFEDSKLETLFNDLYDVPNSRNLMQKKIGDQLTKAIKKRTNQIYAATTFSMLQKSGIGKLESLTGNFKGLYSLRLSANERLLIKPKTKDLSAESLKNCKSIIIDGVYDYHGKTRKFKRIIP